MIQLCRMLRLSCINVLEDSPRFDEVASHLKTNFGATIVLKDTDDLHAVLDADILKKWQGIYRPRLALDGIGGRSGERLAQCLTERCPLVVYGLRDGNSMPRPPLWTLLAGAVSVEPFSLGRWVATHSAGEYLQMLEELSELVNGQKLKLDLQILNCAEGLAGSCLSPELLAEGLGVTGGKEVRLASLPPTVSPHPTPPPPPADDYTVLL